MITLRTLGEVRIEAPAQRLSSRRKELTLLTYLARRSPRGVPRAELAGLLWEGTEEARGRQSLRQALLELKRVVGEGLTTDGELVRLDPGAVQLDASAFEAAIGEGRPADAVRWWHGEFLAGLEDVGGETFRTWLEVEREHLRQALAGAFQQLTAAAGDRGDWEAAAGWASQWTDALPLDERGHRDLIQALVLAGRPADARRRYAAAAARLRLELGAEPGPDLRRVSAQLEREPAETASAHRPGSAALFTPDLIGRAPALAELNAAWISSRSGRPATVILEGETGIGKSRLVEEFLRGLRSREAGLIRITLGSADPRAPRDPVRALLTGLATAPDLTAAPPDALATAAALIPGIAARFPTLAGSPDRMRPEEAAVELVRTVAEDRSMVVFLDDLETADDETVALVAAIVRQSTGRVLTLAALGTDQEPASALVAALSGAPRVRRLKLPALSAGEVEALVASMLVLSAGDRHLLATRLYAEAGGNPLYTIELAAALVDEGVLEVGEQGSWRLLHPEGWRAPLPGGLREIIASRLARLSDDARIVARSMAGLDPEGSEDAARAAAGLPAERFDLGRDELIARRLIRLAPRHSGSFLFSHEVIRRVVLEGLHPPAVPAPAAAPSSAGRGRTRRRALVTIGVALAAAASGLAAMQFLAARSSIPAAEERDLVVARPELAPDATRPESVAARALRLAIDRAVPYRQLPATTLRATLARMRRDTALPLDEAAAREVAARSGVGLVLVPSVARVSDRITVTYRLAEAETGRTLKVRGADAPPDDEPGRLVARLVEPLEADVTAAARRVPARAPLPQVTTTSLEALRAYATASQLITKGDPDWVPLMRRAIELDSTFAAAYGFLAYEYWFNYDQLKAAEYADIGERLARALPTAERLQVQLDIANAREDWAAAIAAARELVDRDPGNPSRWLTLAQLYYFDRQYSRAVSVYDSAVQRYAPARPPGLLMNRATVLARVGREREAAALYEEGFAAESSLVRHPFVSHEYGVTLIRLGRIDDARAAYRRRLDDVPAERAGGLRSMAMLEAHLGHFATAAQLLTDADAASSASNDTVGTAVTHLLRGEVNLTRGRRALALADLAAIEATAARRLLPYEVLARSVKLLARLGAPERGEALLRRLGQQTTAVSRGARARILLAQGEILLARGRSAEGRRVVEQALALEPTDDALESAGHAAMVTGDPRTAAGRYDSLAAQHAIDWDGHAVIELGRYLAGRARDAAAEPLRAAADYKEFLSAWPDADADLPAVVDARRRLETLQR